jgi:hypothetical protein
MALWYNNLGSRGWACKTPESLKYQQISGCIMVVLLQTPIEASDYTLLIGLAILVYAVLAIRFTKVHVALLSTLALSVIYVLMLTVNLL